MNQDHPEVKFGKNGILLVNLGTPNSTGWWDIRKYLKEFLSDQRIIQLPKIFWLPILYLFILPFRPRKKVKDYKKIWMKDGSPLLVYTKRLLQKLNNSNSKTNNIIIDIAMRYGEPGIKEKLLTFQKKKLII